MLYLKRISQNVNKLVYTSSPVHASIYLPCIIWPSRQHQHHLLRPVERDVHPASPPPSPSGRAHYRTRLVIDLNLENLSTLFIALERHNGV